MTKYIYLILWSLVILVGWTFKNSYFSHQIIGEAQTGLIFLGAVALTLFLVSFQVMSGKVRYAFLAFSLYLLVSFLLYGDVLYERYYSSILSLELLDQAGQTAEVGDSVITLIRQSDLLYLVDIVVLLPLLIMMVVKRQAVKNRMIGSSFLVVGIILFIFISVFSIDSQYSDQYKVAKAGILPAHLHASTIFFNENKLAPAMGQDDSNEELEGVNQYFVENQNEKSPYFGVAEGKNVVIVQGESMNNFVIGMEVDGVEITPNLNDLVEKSFYYNQIYTQIGKGNTSDAEFIVNNSLFPAERESGYTAYETGIFRSLPIVLGEEGYQTSVAHGNDPEFWNRKAAYPAQGFDKFYNGTSETIDSSQKLGLGISDESMYGQLVDIYEKQAENGPFYNFFITLTQHRPFKLPEDKKYLDLPERFDDTAVGDYLQSTKYADETLGLFINDLKERGLWEDTLFVFYGDHYGLLPEKKKELDELIGVTFDRKEMYNVPLLIHYPGQEEGEVSDVIGGMVDIKPTVTSLLGLEDSIYHVGKDLTSKEEGFVGFRHGFPKYTFFGETYSFDMSPTGEFTKGTCTKTESGETVDVENCRDGYERIKKQIEMSDKVLENNLLERLKSIREESI
ncbi:LTA synthase family protein [Guptibacillus algicola]|uniref:LTA synthase family protein n=1 Tax=Guptibacillus algicola TaxID=225844 RepID=UPI001CD3DD73|nr:LTA synthase family protein [Alkalihalobacillus algicola]MCA0987097.1 LTA synthase family protein [Alkalihalobacillus algicola]